jgi:hypothetical protein
MTESVCNQCGEKFEHGPSHDQHMIAAHPVRTISAADVEKALAPIDFPKSKAELLAIATVQIPMDATIVAALESLPERVYGSAAEVAASAKRWKQPEDHGGVTEGAS